MLTFIQALFVIKLCIIEMDDIIKLVIECSSSGSGWLENLFNIMNFKPKHYFQYLVYLSQIRIKYSEIVS